MCKCKRAEECEFIHSYMSVNVKQDIDDSCFIEKHGCSKRHISQRTTNIFQRTYILVKCDFFSNSFFGSSAVFM